MTLSNIFVSLVLLLATISCANMQTSDFEIMIRLPASQDCYGVKVMSGTETRYPEAQCNDMVKRAIFLTSDSWKLLRGDIQTNCQYQQCTQIRGAADGLFLSIDQALQKIPVP